MSTKSLEGKVALITGASKGLGRAMAIALAGAGARLALVSRDQKQLNLTAEQVKAAGGQSELFNADMTDEAQVRKLEQDIVGKFGKVQILINNAGINIRKSITDFTLAEWNQVLNTNLTGVFLMCRSFVPHMIGQGYGRILNMTSIMSHVALELAPENITVNGISPGPFGTEMNTPIMQNPEANQQFIANIPLGRWGKVEEVGQLAVYLCSEESGFITGTDILIDGGWTAR
jgi:NAD(P)-dependent dehydrogenase (short-subunit alcohol dehydrogenase family)